MQRPEHGEDRRNLEQRVNGKGAPPLHGTTSRRTGAVAHSLQRTPRRS
jgi:hypothetical protein